MENEEEQRGKVVSISIKKLKTSNRGKKFNFKTFDTFNLMVKHEIFAEVQAKETFKT